MDAAETGHLVLSILHTLDANQITSINDLFASGRDLYGMQTFDQHLMDLLNLCFGHNWLV